MPVPMLCKDKDAARQELPENILQINILEDTIKTEKHEYKRACI